MWIRRNDSAIFFSLDEIYEIKIKKNFFTKRYVIKIFFKDKKQINFCESKDYNVIYNIFNLIMKSIENNNAISLEIDYIVNNETKQL